MTPSGLYGMRRSRRSKRDFKRNNPGSSDVLSMSPGSPRNGREMYRQLGRRTTRTMGGRDLSRGAAHSSTRSRDFLRMTDNTTVPITIARYHTFQPTRVDSTALFQNSALGAPLPRHMYRYSHFDRTASPSPPVYESLPTCYPQLVTLYAPDVYRPL
jgi:hypothetical protein